VDVPIVDALVQTPVADSFRVQQIAGMFGFEVAGRSERRVRAELPGIDEVWAETKWRIGLITGSSGSGKSTLARAAFGSAVWDGGDWAVDAAVVDGFKNASIHRVVRILTAVGFSSPPAWLRPYRTLSNGERFRCDLARALLCGGSTGLTTGGRLVVFDEFTSVVDRTVARVASAACARAIREGVADDPENGNVTQFVAVTCHDDVADWLCPDWQLDLTDGALLRFGAAEKAGSTEPRELLRRPAIELEIIRVATSAWELFRQHHYLSHSLHRAARCYLALVAGRPAAFTAVLPFPHARRPGWREHRTVCLPDFQGVGIGHALADFVAAMYAATGRPYFSTSGHPAMLNRRARSRLWRMIRRPGRTTGGGRGRLRSFHAKSASDRLTASFEFIGPRRPEEARRFGLKVPAEGRQMDEV
jgi:GNAT superfamily N-acetyltransferase